MENWTGKLVYDIAWGSRQAYVVIEDKGDTLILARPDNVGPDGKVSPQLTFPLRREYTELADSKS